MYQPITYGKDFMVQNQINFLINNKSINLLFKPLISQILEKWVKYSGLKQYSSLIKFQSNVSFKDTQSYQKCQNIHFTSITASMFTCLNCKFYNILAAKSAIFEIKTQDQGIIRLIQITANDIISDLKQVSNSSGCISIYSQNSLLDIKIQQSEFQNVFNRMASSVLSIQASQILNMISLTDLQIYDCLSLMNQILFVQFSHKIIDKNNLEIRNIKITQNKDSWISLLSQMGNLSFTELLDISSSQNSLFYVESSSISMINVSLVGLYLSSILNVVNAPKLKLSKLQIKQIQRFYSFNLIIINQMIDIESEVVLHQVNIFNSSTYLADQQKILLSDFNFMLNGCFMVASSSANTSGNQSFYFLNEILITIEQHSQTLLSLIYIQSLSKKHSFYFNQLEILKNDCIHCVNGLILFNLLTFYNIQIQELNCNYNIIKQYGCLRILDENQESLPIRLLSSNFIQNIGSQGVAISSNSPIIIKNCKIIENKASLRGGGVYLILNSNSFIIQNSIIIGNQANEGGEIYFEGDSNLNRNNFIQNYLLFNQAYVYANNLVESPTHLALFVNSLEMQGDKLISDKTKTNILRIFPYFTILQEVKIKTDYLMLPSGQTIQDFSLTIPKQKQNYKYIKQLELKFKNNLNELQKNLINSTCIITEKIVKRDGIIIDGNNLNFLLLYAAEKQHFDLSSISFSIDPYKQDYKYCACKKNIQQGIYKMNTQNKQTIIIYYNVNILSYYHNFLLLNKKSGRSDYNDERNHFDFFYQKKLFLNQLIVGNKIIQIENIHLRNLYISYTVLRDFTCSTQEYKNPLKYIISTKSYKCQLGEFYVDNGCQICESNQGFYYVTYDSIKCSIFDIEKFQEITSNQIKLQEGYWRPHYLSDQSTLCFKITKFCKGGWDYGDALCSEGHIGALCEECDISNVRGNGKFIKNQQNSECFLCFGIQDIVDQDSLHYDLNLINTIKYFFQEKLRASRGLRVGENLSEIRKRKQSLLQHYPFYFKYSLVNILNNLTAILSIILTLKSIGKSNDLFLLYKIQGSLNQILFKLNQDFEGILIKMLLNYLWIFSVIYTLNISFSFQFNFVDQASNSSYSMANNLDCYLSKIVDVELIYSKIILILVLILLQFMIIIFGLIMQKFIIQIQQHFQYFTLLCFVLSYREISNILYISGDLTLKFNTEAHYKWVVYLVLPGLIIFGCLIPPSLFLLMYVNRNGLDNYIFRPHICYLYNEYEKETYYWEQIKLSKRTIMILILTYFETNIHLKVSLIGLCLIIYQLLAINKKPYIITKLNKLDLQTGQICLVQIFLSAVKYESEQLNNIVLSLTFQICLIVLFLMITFPFIDSIGKIYYKKYKLVMLRYLYQIFKYF